MFVHSPTTPGKSLRLFPLKILPFIRFGALIPAKYSLKENLPTGYYFYFLITPLLKVNKIEGQCRGYFPIYWPGYSVDITRAF